MFNNCHYNKIKILHRLSCLSWFIEKHATQDAKNENHAECAKAFEELKKDLTKHLEKIDKLLCK
jgi:hypothetical protein